MSLKNKNITQLELEQILLGEIDKNDFSHILDLNSRLNQLKESNEQVLGKYTPEIMEKRILKKLESQNLLSKFMELLNNKMFLGTMATCCLLVLIIPTFIIKPKPNFRLKGEESTISIYKKTSDNSTRLSNLAQVKEGDILQVSYISRTHTHGVIFSIDGRGSITLHYPNSKDAPNKLENNKEVALNESFELDDSPDYEVFFFVTSTESFNINSILKAGKKLVQNPKGTLEKGKLPLGDSFSQYSIILKKETKE